MWCFPDRATANTDAALRRMESRSDSAVVPWVWQVEVGNALGKAVVKGKAPLARALEIWDELLLLPIRQVAIGSIPQLLQLAVRLDLSLYDTCYWQAALVSGLPLATNDKKLRAAAESCGVATLEP
ncbi:MAG: type II toxin-antitoxin system VapC family toxin [Bryobacteraceae bacterium]